MMVAITIRDDAADGVRCDDEGDGDGHDRDEQTDHTVGGAPVTRGVRPGQGSQGDPGGVDGETQGRVR